MANLNIGMQKNRTEKPSFVQWDIFRVQRDKTRKELDGEGEKTNMSDSEPSFIGSCTHLCLGGSEYLSLFLMILQLLAVKMNDKASN